MGLVMEAESFAGRLIRALARDTPPFRESPTTLPTSFVGQVIASLARSVARPDEHTSIIKPALAPRDTNRPPANRKRWADSVLGAVVVAAGLAIVFVVVGAIFPAQRTDPHGLPVSPPPAWSGFGGWNLFTAIMVVLGISFTLLGAGAVAYLIYSRRRHKDDEDESNDRKT
jgi:hypothetical protein